MNKAHPTLARIFSFIDIFTSVGVLVWFMAAILAEIEGFKLFVPFHLVEEYLSGSQIFAVVMSPLSVLIAGVPIPAFRYLSHRLKYNSDKEMNRAFSRTHRKSLKYCGKVESVSINEEPGLMASGIFTLITDTGMFRCRGTFNAIQKGARVQQDGNKLILRTPGHPKTTINLAPSN